MNSRKDRIGNLRTTKLPPEFFELQADPIFWQAKARQLHRAALLLAHQFFDDAQAVSQSVRAYESGQLSELPSHPVSVMDQFVLLAAFALENLFKGLVLYKEPNLVNGGKIAGILTSHDLLSLAGRADVSLTAEENQLCVLASSASISWGRYPVSTSAGTTISSVTVNGRAVQTFDELVQRVDSLFKERFHSRTRAATPPSA
jgi:hypothetical protein